MDIIYRTKRRVLRKELKKVVIKNVNWWHMPYNKPWDWWWNINKLDPKNRSKLKQTEMECEYLKRWFGSLTEQNRRLQREVEELRAMKVAPPTVISPHTCEPLPASTLTMCPRCERVTTTNTTTTSLAGKDPTTPPTLSSKLHSRHSSAACWPTFPWPGKDIFTPMFIYYYYYYYFLTFTPKSLLVFYLY